MKGSTDSIGGGGGNGPFGIIPVMLVKFLASLHANLLVFLYSDKSESSFSFPQC